MRGNLIEASISTVTAGSPDSITLADVAGSPNFDDVFGSSGSIRVQFTMLQYTDSTRTQIDKAQGGIGVIDLSTLILQPTEIKWTWSGSAYANNDPPELTFTAGADTTRVIASASVDFIPSSLPVFGADGSAGVGFTTIQHGQSTATVNSTNQRLFFIPRHMAAGRYVTSATVRCTGAYTGGTSDVLLGLYEWGKNGLPGRRLLDFGSAGNLSTSNVYLQTTPLSTGLFIPPGWYFDAVLTTFSGGSGTPSLRNSSNSPNLMVGAGTGGVATYAYLDGRTSLPSDATGESFAFIVNATPYCVWMN